MFKQTFEFKLWADQRTLTAINKIEKAAFSKAYAFCLQQLNHMLMVEELFKSRLTNTSDPHQSTNAKVVPSFDILKARLLDSGNWYLRFASSNLDCQKSISFTFTDGNKGMMTVEEIFFHILTHGSYHRGNIAHALDSASVSHPVDGYGLYIHEIEPQRRNAE